MSEAAEYKHWPNGGEKASEAKLSDESVAGIADALNGLSFEAFAGSSTIMRGRETASPTIRSAEALDAVGAGFGGDLDESRYLVPVIERKLQKGKYRYTLQLEHEDIVGDTRFVEYVFDEADGTLQKISKETASSPVLELDAAEVRSRLAAAKRERGMSLAGVDMFLGGIDDLPENLRESTERIEALGERLGNTRMLAKKEFRLAVEEADEEEGDFRGSMAMISQTLELEEALDAETARFMEGVIEYGEENNHEDLAELARSYLKLQSSIKALEDRQADVVLALGSADAVAGEAQPHKEMATEENGIASEFIRILRALSPQDSQE